MQHYSIFSVCSEYWSSKVWFLFDQYILVEKCLMHNDGFEVYITHMCVDVMSRRRFCCGPSVVCSRWNIVFCCCLLCQKNIYLSHLVFVRAFRDLYSAPISFLRYLHFCFGIYRFEGKEAHQQRNCQNNINISKCYHTYPDRILL